MAVAAGTVPHVLVEVTQKNSGLQQQNSNAVSTSNIEREKEHAVTSSCRRPDRRWGPSVVGGSVYSDGGLN